MSAKPAVHPGKFWGIRLLSVIGALAFCFGIQALSGVIDPFVFRIVTFIGLYITLAVSLNLINGITGQFSIGHAGFYMVGAYVTGFLTEMFYEQQSAGPVAWLLIMVVVGALAAALVGLIVGLPSLRLRGDYLAIVTLGFGEIIRITAINIEAVGGSYGLKFAPKIQEPWLIWLLAIVCIAVCRNLLKNAHGLPFLAVREDEVASQAMGVNTTMTKVIAFVIGAAFAGGAGVLLAHYEGFITPDQFKMEVSFIVLTMVVIGGTGSITGSVIAATVLYALPEWMRTLKGPDGNELQVSAAVLLGAVIAVIAGVVIARHLINTYHKPTKQRVIAFSATAIGAIILAIVLGPLLSTIPTLADKTWPVGQLRMVVFAITLIIVMLLRPQGVFGHHEFSWGAVGRLFGKGKPSEAKA